MQYADFVRGQFYVDENGHIHKFNGRFKPGSGFFRRMFDKRVTVRKYADLRPYYPSNNTKASIYLDEEE